MERQRPLAPRAHDPSLLGHWAKSAFLEGREAEACARVESEARMHDSDWIAAARPLAEVVTPPYLTRFLGFLMQGCQADASGGAVIAILIDRREALKQSVVEMLGSLSSLDERSRAHPASSAWLNGIDDDDALFVFDWLLGGDGSGTSPGAGYDAVEVIRSFAPRFDDASPGTAGSLWNVYLSYATNLDHRAVVATLLQMSPVMNRVFGPKFAWEVAQRVRAFRTEIW